MADALSYQRLAMISLVAICAMVTWLIFNNRLGERPCERNDGEEAVLFNLATVLT